MSRLYLDRAFFAQKRRSRRYFAVPAGRINRRLLIGGGIALFVLVSLGGVAYWQRRQLADAWRQYRVASIPPPPAVSQPAVAESNGGSDSGLTESTTEGSVDATEADTDAGDTDTATAVDAVAPDSSTDGETAPATGGTGSSTGSTASAAPGDVSSGNSGSTTAESGQLPPPGPTTLPARANLDVPMVYQAPLNIWDEKHDDACEEASALMLSNYWEGKRSLTRQEMEDQILALIDYQLGSFGFYKDTDAAQTVQFMKDYLGMERVAVLPVNSIDDIRRQIAAGRPVILPADGKALQNPNFRNGGPPYHMLVVKGYTEDNIIANDPGTRRGANWLYTNEIIMDAVHDWNGGDVKNGQPVMIVAW